MPSGGAREGAGAKPKPQRKVKLTVGFDPDLADWLKSQKGYNKLLNELVKAAKDKTSTSD